MIILLKGVLEALDFFVDCIDAGLSEPHLCIDIKRLENIDYFLEMDRQIDENTMVITFNCVGMGLDCNGDNYWMRKRVTVYNILVDHPFHYMDTIKKINSDNVFYVCIDMGHTFFLEEIFPNRVNNFLFIPHGGAKVKCEASKRDIDILYVGGCSNPRSFSGIFNNPDYADFINYLEDYYETTDYPEGPIALLDLFNDQANLEDSVPFASLMSVVLAHEEAIISKRRKSLVEDIVKSGFNVTVCGPGVWEKMADEMPNNYTYLGFVTPKKCIELMTRTKIVINDLPFFAYGAHERVFNGMLNGAVVLTNKSAYLSERFNDGVDILYWDGHNTDDAIDKLSVVLADENYLNAIRTSAASKAQSDYWANRVRLLMEHKNRK